VLHDQFEWDDAICGEHHRLAQARILIRSVHVHVQTERRDIAVVRYVRDPSAESHEQGYVSIQQLRTEPTAARAAVRYEFLRAEACLVRAQNIAEVLGLKRDVDLLIKQVRRVREKIAQ